MAKQEFSNFLSGRKSPEDATKSSSSTFLRRPFTLVCNYRGRECERRKDNQ